MKCQFLATTFILCLGLILNLNACQSETFEAEVGSARTQSTETYDIMAAAPSPQQARMEAPQMAPQMAKTHGQSALGGTSSQPIPKTGNPSDISYLAYRYTFGYALPAKSVIKTANAHAEFCQNAGPQKCQLLSSNNAKHSESDSYANLSLRVAPNWLNEFKQNLTMTIEAEDGTLMNSGLTAEDLTRSILDTDARLKALRTLRIRLQNLLETKDAELNELLSLERELSRVQGQIESTSSQLKALRKRVNMSVVDISYQSQAVSVSRDKISPIGRALKAFIGNIAQGVANVINVIAYILPWMILVIPALWLIRRFWRRRKAT